MEPVAQFAGGAGGHPFACRGFLFSGCPLDGADLDALLVGGTLEDAVHVDARRVDLVGIELPHPNQLLDLGDGDFPTGGDHGVEVARGFSVDEVAQAVAFPGLHQGDVGADGRLKHIFQAVKFLCLLPLGELGADGRAGIEPRDASASGTESLGQRSLGHELQIELAAEHLALELFVLPHVGGKHPADLAGFQKQAHPEIIHPGIVAH